MNKNKKTYFVSTPTAMAEFETKKSAVDYARKFGGSVYRTCECGCGNPASKATVSFPEAK